MRFLRGLCVGVRGRMMRHVWMLGVVCGSTGWAMVVRGLATGLTGSVAEVGVRR